MSDIDDELLALAGGGDMSSDDEGSMREQSQSPPPAPAKETPAKDMATKKAPAKETTTKRAQQDNSDEEEGEASDADSLDSAPMDESDSDDDDASTDGKARGGAAAGGGGGDDDDDNKYPVDGLFVSHAEKEEIMSMREVEREQILAERIQEKERAQQNRLLRQLVTNNEEKKQKKRKAGAAELDGDSQRKTSRVRTKAGETGSAFDSLRRARQEKEERSRRRDMDREKGRRLERSPSAGSDRSRGSDVSWGTPPRRSGRSRSPEVKEIPPADLGDLNRIRLSRTRFAEVCFHPGFDEAITGCYVRINIGPEPNTRENVYRVALIKGFSTGKAYALQNAQGKDLVTDQYVRAAHGKSAREWPFISCSESPFTEGEWERYKSVLRNESLPMPKRPALENKVDDINRLINHVWTEGEVADSVTRKTELKMKFNGTYRAQLEHQIREARGRGALDKVDALQEKLDQIETPRLAFRTSLATPGSKKGGGPHAAANGTPAGPGTPSSSQQDRLAQVNAENRRKNAEAVRRAQLKERARVREIEAKLERGEEVEEDMSRRLRTKAKFIHDANEQFEKKPSSLSSAAATPNGNSAASTPADGTPNLGASRAALPPHLAKLQQQKSGDKNSLPTIHRPLMDDDIIGALDLDIDVEID